MNKSKSLSKKTSKASKSKKEKSRSSAKEKKTLKNKTEKPKAKLSKLKLKGLKYSVKQRIVYPLHGVGQIVSIEEREFHSKKLLYYIIYIEVSDMTIMMPVTEAEERGIRPIVSKNEAQRALQIVAKDCQPLSADWKMRYQLNQELLKKGNITDVAKVVRSLYSRSKIKELPILERKLFDNALKLLIDEISYSLNKEKSEIEELIYKKMESK